MKKKKIALVLVTMALVFSAADGSLARGQEKKNPAPSAILGAWNLQVDAGGEYYDLTMTLTLKEKKLTGLISESNGYFTDVALTDLAWDGITLKFKASTATPPDGAERPWDSELKLAEGKWIGVLNIADLGVTAPVTGSKK